MIKAIKMIIVFSFGDHRITRSPDRRITRCEDDH